MKNFWVLVLALIPFNSLASQEVQHAPTVEQCRADQKLWYSKLEEPNNAGVANVDYWELAAWEREMVDCESVDPTNRLFYYNTYSEALATQKLRLKKFLDRHDLFDKFIAEDAQGTR